MARTCRESPCYYYGIKFALSAYSTLFSLLGLLLLAVGIYAEAERQRHRTLEGIFLAPAVLLLLLGITVFLVSFLGMLGSLRDNRTLLRMFFWVLLLIFLTELLLILVEIIFESKMNEVFHSNIQEGIRHYYDDLDFKNILDFVQEKFSCCGGDEFRDWEVNQYHACNGSGALACGVPHSCCIRGAPGVVNTLCGSRALDKERLELLGAIHVRGCIHAVGLWLKDNFQATLAIVCSLLLPQVLGLAMAWLYWQQLDEIHSRLDSVDFRLPEPRDLSFGSLDLRGAGWCWCLPREGGYVPVDPGYIPMDPGHIPVDPDCIPVDPDCIPVDPDCIPVDPDCIPVDPCYVQVNPGHVPLDPSCIPVDPSCIPVDPGRIPVDPSCILVDPGYVPVDPGHIPVDPDCIPVDPDCIPVDLSHIPVNPGHIPVDPDCIPVDPGHIPVDPSCIPVDPRNAQEEEEEEEGATWHSKV